MDNLDSRHPAIQDVAMWFHYDHLPPKLYDVSKKVHDLAEEMIDAIPDDAQLTIGLQHLLTAKDCFVRAIRKSIDGGPKYTPLHE
jgi:hypothetical protein